MPLARDGPLAPHCCLPTTVCYNPAVPFSDRSQATREAILAAARNQFGARGFEATTIRSVAAEAGIHPSMVMRYYTNKDGLFDAAIDVDLNLPDLERVPARQRGAVLARHLVERWEGQQADEGLILLLRSLATNPAAAARARAVFAGQVLRLVERIVSDPAEAPVRAAMVSSQVLGIALCRYVVKIPPLADMAPDRLVTTLTPHLQHHLAGRYPQL
jgi:AcrR family transcriptional regulator